MPQSSPADFPTRSSKKRPWSTRLLGDDDDDDDDSSSDDNPPRRPPPSTGLRPHAPLLPATNYRTLTTAPVSEQPYAPPPRYPLPYPFRQPADDDDDYEPARITRRLPITAHHTPANFNTLFTDTTALHNLVAQQDATVAAQRLFVMSALDENFDILNETEALRANHDKLKKENEDLLAENTRLRGEHADMSWKMDNIKPIAFQLRRRIRQLESDLEKARADAHK
ncbi:hypothetical protein CALVIDRAFT_560807 [Calocera viscosa TUFC12733]|uniref:Uncharacterized protein n=1 Tax=Calocera viscosa (strain TUFC12733) TaxID=1330018 RepID=A0A167QTC0_CALVF|nr:hypothetical protein CALVIDRAFT_560807 [Calocera viscosa TUFC12733]